MSTPAPEARFLDPFASYLSTLGEDAAALAAVLARGDGGPADRHVAAGLNYVFKALDLVPDGIDDLGFMDDAFVIRVAASLAAGDGAADETVTRLAREAEDVRAFMARDYARLEAYVRELPAAVARGRTADDVVADGQVRETFVREVEQWARDYRAPSFTRDVKTLVKLRAFLGAKLPS